MALPIPGIILCVDMHTGSRLAIFPRRYLLRLLTSIICRGKGQRSDTIEVSHKEINAMKKFLVILTLVLLVSAFAVPAALAHTSGPVGNTTTVTAGGQHNNGVVVVNGKGNITTLNFASKTKWNVGVVGVVGCRKQNQLSPSPQARNTTWSGWWSTDRASIIRPFSSYHRGTDQLLCQEASWICCPFLTLA